MSLHLTEQVNDFHRTIDLIDTKFDILHSSTKDILKDLDTGFIVDFV
jgi:hypothetical protein